jgi:predicted flap endonuclease-1-like 5' DNA nuclease
VTPASRCPSPLPPATLITLATVMWLVGIATSSTPQVHARPCARAVMIDDLLRCDEEAPQTIEDLCGPDHALAAREIDAGDRIESRRLCEGDATALARMSAIDLRRLAVAIDVNHAPIDELRSLPGIGPVLAERIVAGRPFADADDLDRVRGIGRKTIEKLRPRLRLR